MKKSICLLAACLLLLSTGYTQSVGINNDHSAPHPSAMLDVKNPTKGLLIPRVALTGTKDGGIIPSPATSLLVYNTATTTGGTAVAPGFYFWNAAEWVRLSTGYGWLLTGNAGTVDGSNFIGTTDNVPLNIKVNNQKAGRIDLLNTSWGYQAGNLITSGSYNTANGVSALQANQAGTANTAIGNFFTSIKYIWRRQYSYRGKCA